MKTDKEIIPEIRDELDVKIKDIFIWALGGAAVTKMTKTVTENDPNKMNINQLYPLFRFHFILERNKFHSRADFGITRESNETAEYVWTRILQTEKNCEFDEVTPAELIASKFLSLIGRSTGDYELKEKIWKSDMTIETLTHLIHEYMFDRLNDSNNSNERRDVNLYKNGHRRENGQKNPVTKETKEDQTTTKKDIKTTVVDNAEHRTGPDNIHAPQNPWSEEIARREDTTKRGVVFSKEYNMWIEQHHQQKITETTTKSKRYTITKRKATTSIYL